MRKEAIFTRLVDLRIFNYIICRRHYMLLSSTMIIAFLATACYPFRPTDSFETYTPPPPPDYSSQSAWASLPEVIDSADVVPDRMLEDGQAHALADVFYIHPTTYIGARGEDQWNAPIDDVELNIDTDKGAIRNQATVFNGCYRVFAPRYRQAHYRAFFTRKKADAQKAFELAYQDVRAAFIHYLNEHNDGRPILIAGHSQGSAHGIRLLQEFFDGKPLQKLLVAAYLPGMKLRESYYDNLSVCKDALDHGCLCGWRTMKEGHIPKNHEDLFAEDLIITNPLTWVTNGTPASRSQNQGAVLLKFYDGIHPEVVSATISDGYVWTEKPEFRGSLWLTTKNYHRGDFNLYYLDVRINACQRLERYISDTRLD